MIGGALHTPPKITYTFFQGFACRQLREAWKTRIAKAKAYQRYKICSGTGQVFTKPEATIYSETSWSKYQNKGHTAQCLIPSPTITK